MKIKKVTELNENLTSISNTKIRQKYQVTLNNLSNPNGREIKIDSYCSQEELLDKIKDAIRRL